jgi:hypothetical protein
MMATLTSLTTQPVENDELLLITQPALRAQLLYARQVNAMSAGWIINRGENVYLSLRAITDEKQRREIAWAVLCLQMGAKLNPEEMPDPLRAALLTGSSKPSPLFIALIFGGVSGVIGGVMVMALVGLLVTVLNVPSESLIGLAATAVSFVFSGAAIGVVATVYFWRRLTRKTAVHLTRPMLVKKTR